MQMTKPLQNLEFGQRDALDAVMALVCDERRQLAEAHSRRNLKPVPRQTTALLHEAFLKLGKGRHPSHRNRAHFYGVASRVMRQVLVEAGLADLPEPGSPTNRSSLAVDEALQRLEKADPLKGKLIEMRYFGGMTAEESSIALSIPLHKVRHQLRTAQAWLRKEMANESSDRGGLR
jgi:DNA-directed RNA polymerase specialized sigma24 family protein